MMQAAQQRGIPNVMLNTNGKRIATDDRFLARAGGSAARTSISSSMVSIARPIASFAASRTFCPKKLRALDRLAEIGCTVILVPAIERGVNEHEIGKIVRFGLDHPAVKGINFQPAFHAGRHGAHDPMQRMTNPDIMRLIEEQTEGCSGRTRLRSGAVLLSDVQLGHLRLRRRGQERDAAAAHSERGRLPRLHLQSRDAGSGRGICERALEGLWSSSAVLGSEKVAREFAFSCSACGLPDGGLDVKGLSNFMFMIMLQDFMDPWTFNQKNLMKCCKEFLLPGGKQIPFCAYNTVGYREQARAQLVAQEHDRVAARRAGTRYEVQPITFRSTGNAADPLIALGPRK